MKPIKPEKPLTANEVVKFLQSKYQTVSATGTEPKEISEVCTIDNTAATECSLTFIRSKDVRQISKSISSSTAGVFLISSQAESFVAPTGKWIITVPEPQIAYVELLEKFFLDREISFLPQAIHPSAIIDDTAKISADAKIGAYVVIGANCVIDSAVIIHPHVVLYHNVHIKSNAILHSHAVIREHCTVGNDCIVQPGAVIGSDGFGYVQDPKLGLRAVPQIGTVEISDRVEIGSNTCIDRATFGVTRIGAGTKLDNLVQIGHNVDIGKHSVVCGQVGIGGSSKIGDGVVLGGQAGVGDHMKIASGVRVGGAGVVISHVEEAGDYMGYPVQTAFKWRRSLAAQSALPEFFKSLRKKKTEE